MTSRALVFTLFLFACGDDTTSADAGPSTDALGRFDNAVRDAFELEDAGNDAGPDQNDAGQDSSTDAGGEDAPGDDGGASACDDGVQNGSESDVDCGGECDTCPNGAACVSGDDCTSTFCDGSCTSPEGTHPDIVRVDDVAGRNPGGRSWADSYSVGNACYCETTFDHNIADIMVDTPAGRRTVREVCEAIGPGPGSDERPLYNDIQCGNGPANDAGDEDDCPGRVDIGREGCGHIGPRWDLSVFE